MSKKNRLSFFLLFLIPVSFFLPVLFNSNAFLFGSDTLVEFYGKRAYLFSQIRHGVFPLWNPHYLCGFPAVAEVQSGLFYPPNLLFVLFPAGPAFTLSYLLHIVLAGWFFYIFLNRFKIKEVPAFSGALIFMLSGYLMSHTYAGHITLVNAYCWIPLILLSGFMIFEDGREVKWAVLGSVFLTLQIFAGHPPTTFYTIIGFTLITLSLLFKQFSTKEGRIKLPGKIAALLIFAFLPLILGAVQLLPAFELARHSARLGSAGYDFFTSFSFPPENLLTFISPFLFGDGVNSSYWGRWLFWETFAYVGIIPLIFSAFLLKINKSYLAKIALTFILVGFFLSFGRYVFYFPFLLKIIPGLEMFRAPARALVLSVVGFSVAAPLFLQNMPEKGIMERKLLNKILFASIFLFLFLVLSLLLVSQAKPNSMPWRVLLAQSFLLEDRINLTPVFQTQEFLAMAHRSTVHSLAVTVGLLCLLSFLLLYLRKKKTGKLSFCIVLLMATDLIWAGARFIRSIEKKEVSWPTELVEYFRSDASLYRITTATGNTIDQSLGMAYGISHAGGTEAGMLARYGEYINATLGKPRNDIFTDISPLKPGKYFNLMGIKYILTDKNKPPYPESKKVLETEGFNLYQNLNSTERIFLVNDWVYVPEAAERFKTISEAKYDPFKTAIVEKTLPMPSGMNNTKYILKTEKYFPSEIEITLSAETPSILVVTDAFYPGWKAVIDGKETDIFPVDHLFRGLFIEPGQHRVKMWYRPFSFYAGLWVSLFGWLILVPVLLWKSRGRIHPPRGRDESRPYSL